MKKILAAGAMMLAAVSGVFATSYDTTVGGTSGYPSFAGRKAYTIVRRLDLSTYTNNVLANDVVKMINIPATSVVLAVSYYMPTVATNSTTVDIGDSGSATRFKSNLDITADGSKTEALYATPIIKGAASDVRITADGDLGHTGVFVIKAVLMDLNEY